jgi:hypothetical protein
VIVWPGLVNGETITLPVWERNKPFVPYTGNTTLEIGKLEISFYEHDPEIHYENTTSIKFTDGNATIDFATLIVKP